MISQKFRGFEYFEINLNYILRGVFESHINYVISRISSVVIKIRF
jgi:hypothetical protein